MIGACVPDEIFETWTPARPRLRRTAAMRCRWCLSATTWWWSSGGRKPLSTHRRIRSSGTPRSASVWAVAVAGVHTLR